MRPLIAHHLQVGTNWPMAESRVQFPTLKTGNSGESKKKKTPFHQWAVLVAGDTERVTQSITFVVISAVHREWGRLPCTALRKARGLMSVWRTCCWILFCLSKTLRSSWSTFPPVHCWHTHTARWGKKGYTLNYLTCLVVSLSLSLSIFLSLSLSLSLALSLFLSLSLSL